MLPAPIQTEEHVVQERTAGGPIRHLDGGLILRRGTAADAAELSALNAAVHGEPHGPDDSIAVWTRDLLTRPHPTFGDGGFAVVEDRARGKIVSSLNLIPQ